MPKEKIIYLTYTVEYLNLSGKWVIQKDDCKTLIAAKRYIYRSIKTDPFWKEYRIMGFSPTEVWHRKRETKK